MELEITPHQGVGNLRFGMIPYAVHSIFGNPKKTKRNKLNELVERYEKLVVVYKKETIRVTEIGFGRDATDLSYKGNQLFEMPPQAALRLLADDDGGPVTTFGFIVFLNLGIAVTGFLDGDDDDRAITLFESGRWDGEKNDMKRIVLR